MTVAELFKCVDLVARAPVKWLQPVTESRWGVYVIALANDASTDWVAHDISYLPDAEQRRWNEGEPTVYVGCTTRPLGVRLNEFYRHRLSSRAPHSGGQSIKRLRCDLWVYWCPTEGDPAVVEGVMLDAFQRRTGGRLPFANRRR